MNNQQISLGILKINNIFYKSDFFIVAMHNHTHQHPFKTQSIYVKKKGLTNQTLSPISKLTYSIINLTEPTLFPISYLTW